MEGSTIDLAFTFNLSPWLNTHYLINGSLQFQLRITNISTTDIGNYTCSVHNVPDIKVSCKYFVITTTMYVIGILLFVFWLFIVLCLCICSLYSTYEWTIPLVPPAYLLEYDTNWKATRNPWKNRSDLSCCGRVSWSLAKCGTRRLVLEIKSSCDL